MTREEAIKIIKIVLVVAENFEIEVQGEEFTEEKCKEAVDMAIEALDKINKIDKIAHIRSIEDLNGLNCEEAILGLFKTVLEELPQEPCTDAISRAEALKHSFPIFDDDGVGYTVVRADKIEQLPPVTPQPCEDVPDNNVGEMDFISRQAVAQVLLKYAHSTEGKAFAEFLISQINDLPPVKPAEKVGQWISIGDFECYCSNCHHWCYKRNKTRYCPSCGRKMQEVEE